MSTTGISFGGVGSGLPVQDWIEAMVKVERQPVDSLYTKKDNYNLKLSSLSTIQSQFSSFRSTVQKLTDANLASAFDLFKAKNATSSDTAIATVTASNKALIQNISMEVSSLATATTAKSCGSVSKSITGTEKFTDLYSHQGDAGVFNIYTDGLKNEIEIEEEDTLDDIVKKINDKFDPNQDGVYDDNSVKASIVGGKFEIGYSTGSYNIVALGSNADTSNFFNMMKLSTAADVDQGNEWHTFTSVNSINSINLEGKIIGNEANLNVSQPITEGTFKIGQAEFTIDANSTISGIISRINNDDEAGVNAIYDATSNKIVMTSKTPGKTYINLEEGTSNFLSRTLGQTQENGLLGSQTLGNNAKVYINSKSTDIPAPTPMEVNSNTITPDISGIAGVTINLKALSSADTPVGTSINLNIEQNTDELYNAVNDFVSKFNTVISSIDSNTASGGKLHGEYSLVTLRNNLRTMVTDRVNGLSTYDNLASLGITSGAVGKSAKESSATISIDKTKFIEALQENPNEVRALLIGDTDTGITGIMQKIEDRLDAVLEPTSGFFKTKKDSINESILDTDKSIVRGEDRITLYKKMITEQFSQMDQYISKMQQQGSALSAIG